ncbi:hypothetical protein I5U65_22310 [Stenotrophomonas maltophilia]|nr:hypothetical protein [Stenotrophomonas maltophilia]
MTTDNKTLADVQPGGRVRLSGRSPNLTRSDDERARFESWATAQGLDPTVRLALTSHPPQDGGYADNSLQQLWQAWQAAVSAQPSPGGQGESMSISDDDRAVLQRLQDALPTTGINGWAKGVDVLERLLRDSLAARQPVGEPVADAVRTLAYDAIDRFLRNNMDDAAYAEYVEHLEALWAAVPAQVVDLGPVRDVFRRWHANELNSTDAMLALVEALAVIDSQAVGK